MQTLQSLLKEKSPLTIPLKEKLSVSVDKYKLNTLNTKTLNHSVTDVRSRALKIADRLNNHSRIHLYLKYAWRLSERELFNNLEQALTGKNPKAYFTWLCERSLAGLADTRSLA